MHLITLLKRFSFFKAKPISIRMHIIEQFNGGIYDTIIASDEKIMELGEEQAINESNKKTPSKK